MNLSSDGRKERRKTLSEPVRRDRFEKILRKDCEKRRLVRRKAEAEGKGSTACPVYKPVKTGGWEERMKKKVLAMFLCCGLVMSGLTGCGGSSGGGEGAQNTQTENEQPAQAEENTQEEASESADAGGSGDRPTVSFVFTKGGFEGYPDNDVILQKIEEAANVTLDHIAPPSANYAEQVNLILSGDKSELPDLVRLNAAMFNDLYDYVDQGALMDMTELVKDCPNILKNVPQEALDRCTVDGKLYAIPMFCSPNRYNVVIRQDWLDNLGLETPVTLEDYHEVMRAFTFDDPDGNGQNDTYGFSGISMEALDFLYGAFGAMAPIPTYNAVNTYWYLEDGELKPQVTNPKVKEALETISAWYKEGLIDPEFITCTTDDDLNNKAMKNQFGISYHWWTWEPKIEAQLQEVDPNISFSRIAPPVGPNGDSGVRGVNLCNGCVMMLQGADNPEACMRLMDWMYSEEGMMTTYTGVEGIHWEQKEDGTYVTLPQFDEDASWIQWYSVFEAEWPLLQVETPLVQSRRDSFQWKTINNDGDGLTTKAEVEYGADLQAFSMESYTNFITGKTSLDEWDKFVEEWNSRGGAQWTEEINAEYKDKRG